MIDYQKSVRDALYEVVRSALRQGVHDNHHFYLTFRTDHPNVQLSKAQKNKSPTQITVVLQHQFYDLKVTEFSISVTLFFNGVSERVIIPFAALMSFADPSVSFALTFTPDMQGSPSNEEPAGDTTGKIVQFPGRRK